MRNVNEYAIRCKKMLDDCGIKYGNISKITVNTRATKRWGLCRQTPYGYEIQIASVLLDERNSEEGLINTMLHEMLHTCKDCMNHGNVWKCHAQQIYRKYGIDIKRTSNSEEKGVEAETRNIAIKHKFVCNGCGQVVTRQRESDFCKYYTNYRCGRCGGKFNKLF